MDGPGKASDRVEKYSEHRDYHGSSKVSGSTSKAGATQRQVPEAGPPSEGGHAKDEHEVEKHSEHHGHRSTEQQDGIATHPKNSSKKADVHLARSDASLDAKGEHPKHNRITNELNDSAGKEVKRHEDKKGQMKPDLNPKQEGRQIA